MELFYQKQIGNDCCSDTQRFTISYLMPEQETLSIHIHDFYEIYYSIAGGKEFFISDSYYEIHPHDVFFIYPNENHHITQMENIRHERINIAIHPKFIEQYSTSQTSLLACFQNSANRVTNLSVDAQKKFDYLIKKIAKTEGFGKDLLENLYLCEILIMLQKNGREAIVKQTPSNDPIFAMAQAVLHYINTHLEEDLPLERLAKEFFISQSYLCRIFKKYTGITINRYISARRISLAMSLMNEGVRPSDVCSQVGFKNYNNFFKTFVAVVGTSPKNYMKYS